eukprot:scaffold9853_cov31-Tisochrysis_lutea.AAC.2
MQSSGPCEQHANYEAQDARAQATGDELPPLLRILCVSFWSLTERDRNDASHASRIRHMCPGTGVPSLFPRGRDNTLSSACPRTQPVASVEGKALRGGSW